MENYKMVNSTKLKEKGERLGLGFEGAGWRANDHFMLVCKGNISSTKFRLDYHAWDVPEITQADFLSLPEPFKKGDWCKFENNEGSYIFQVEVVHSDWLEPTEVLKNIYKYPHDGHYINYCTKLSQKQIEVLEL